MCERERESVCVCVRERERETTMLVVSWVASSLLGARVRCQKILTTKNTIVKKEIFIISSIVSNHDYYILTLIECLIQ